MSLGWGIFMLFHINFTVMIHTVSIFLTLALAIWRFIMIKFHSLATEICTIKRCRNLLFLAFGNFIISLLMSLPFISLQSIIMPSYKLSKHFLVPLNNSIFLWLF